MAALESQANYALTDIDYTTPAPAMAAATPSQTQFIVLFDFDSVDYAPGNGTIVREALDAALASAGSALRITGHAARSGAVAYNQTLSARPANPVIEDLVSGGRTEGRRVGKEGSRTRRCRGSP